MWERKEEGKNRDKWGEKEKKTGLHTDHVSLDSVFCWDLKGVT